MAQQALNFPLSDSIIFGAFCVLSYKGKTGLLPPAPSE